MEVGGKASPSSTSPRTTSPRIRRLLPIASLQAAALAMSCLLLCWQLIPRRLCRSSARQGSLTQLGWGELPNRNDHQPLAKRPRRASVHSQIETNGEALSCARGSRLSGLSDARGWRRRGEKREERQFPAWRSDERSHQREALHQLAV